MKLNWGTSIVIAIIAFIGFIMYFVITMSTDKSYNHDLVTEKYYQKELTYQESINASKNAKQLSSPVKIYRSSNGLTVEFPENFDPTLLKGKVFLYRPSNKHLDFEMPLSLSNNYLLVPENRLLDGRWNITVQWTYKDTPYLVTDEILY
ncbi:Cytochrome C oxidase Cbb3 [Tenacibaculum litopenaei]|jgi:nitrogen fixation protein FixH|uniref:FixH family protein n=1 Tax=Tenacibaculum litopenaei TaxID=396016 RepID=UPI003893681F